MPIAKPEEMNFSSKKLFIIIAGVPGIGKTTLALSAPKPLLIDCDNGISRVEARYRKDTLTGDSLQAIEEELKGLDLTPYESIVLDTGGAAFDMLKREIIAVNPQARQRDGSLSLKGYGIAKTRYKDFIDFLRSLNKHLIVVFHASEVVIDDETKATGYRIRIEGATRSEIWDGADLGGFMETKGEKRTISFKNCDRFYAKGTRGVNGVYDVPDLRRTLNNVFMTRLIELVCKSYEAENDELRRYEKAMSFKKWIDAAKTTAEITKCLQAIEKLDNALTSKIELTALAHDKAKAIAAENGEVTQEN